MVQPDRVERSVVTTSAAGVPDVFRPNFLLMAVAPTDANTSPVALSILRETPGMVFTVADMAYQNPNLIQKDQRDAHNPITLPFIRESFPAIPEVVEEAVLTEQVLVQFPQFKNRIDTSLADLKGLGETNVRPIDLVLAALMEDGRLDNKKIEDYPTIVRSHDLYGVLAEIVMAGRNRITRTEEYAFINLGQSLLKTRLMFEAKEAVYDEERHSVKPHENRETDYRGRVARLITFSRSLRLLVEVGDTEVTRGVRNGILSEISNLVNDFPDKAQELSPIIGDAQSTLKVKRWTEEAGAAELTKAEEISFLNAE